MQRSGALRNHRKISLYFACFLALALLVFVSYEDSANIDVSFADSPQSMNQWLFTDSAGNAQTVSLPYTISYGTDGKYTLEADVPAIHSPSESTFCFYSNYVDVAISLNGETLLVYPENAAFDFGGTGNTYHFVDLPQDCEGARLRVDIRCQLGDDITYLLRAPLLGSKASILNADMRRSLPSIVVACCLFILSVLLIFIRGIMKAAFEKKSDLGYFSAFIMLFSVYVALENELAEVLIPSSRFVYMTTFLMLILMPIPIFELFIQYTLPKFNRYTRAIICVCYLNFFVQTALHILGICDYRAMMPITHGIIIAGMLALLLFMMRSGRESIWRALTAAPMIVGGGADIVLLALNKPSFNNNMFYIIGVTSYILIQFGVFSLSYLRMYHTAVESEVLHAMAYSDMLTGLNNRNAYERRLRALSEGVQPTGLCCIVADLNGLKKINDTYGHSAGDASLVEMGETLRALVPESGESFRTGGDEFVVLLTGMSEEEVSRLSDAIAAELERRGRERNLPLMIAVGFGRYSREDDSIQDFIRRIDTLMYIDKHHRKSEAANSALRPGGMSPG